MENMKKNGSDEQVIASASAPRRPVAAETQQSRKKSKRAKAVDITARNIHEIMTQLKREEDANKLD